MLQPLRRLLGRAKCVIVDELPYRHEVRRIPQFREQARKSIHLLVPINILPGNPIEVQMFCGKRDLDMGIWASWSLFRFLDGRGRLYVHSDGSLDEDDLKTWRRVIEGLVVIEKMQINEQARRLLAEKCPLLNQWRTDHWASVQLIDMHLAGNADSILVMDSDVLCFSRPDAVLETIDRGEFGWCGGVSDAYSTSVSMLHEITDVKVARKLCAGFLVSPRLEIEDFIIVERILEKIRSDGRIDWNHYWSCQTYIAILAGLRGGGTIFPPGYSNCMRRTKSRQVLRHYFGVPCVRFRYFKEGIPRICKQIADAKRIDVSAKSSPNFQ